MPAGADPQLVSVVRPVLAALAEGSGLQLRELQALGAADLNSDIQLVVTMPPDPGVAGLAAAAPRVQFLAVQISGLQAVPNLSWMEALAARPDLLGFTAGYLAAAITPDWRVGVISEAGTVAGKAARHGFTNGVFYFCGLCRPVYPPFPIPGYPMYGETIVDARPADWESILDSFAEWQVKTVYVQSAVANPDLLSRLAESGYNLIGDGAAPPGLGDHWVASINPGDIAQALQQVWPRLMNGEGGHEIELPISLDEVNPLLLSPGRQRMVQAMLADLLDGFIDSGVDPQSGEYR